MPIILLGPVPIMLLAWPRANYPAWLRANFLAGPAPIMLIAWPRANFLDIDPVLLFF